MDRYEELVWRAEAVRVAYETYAKAVNEYADRMEAPYAKVVSCGVHVVLRDGAKREGSVYLWVYDQETRVTNSELWMAPGDRQITKIWGPGDSGKSVFDLAAELEHIAR